MRNDWAHLTRMTGDRAITVTRVEIDGENTAIEGAFELPPLARLDAEDQVFVAVFVKSHGSIKQMEKHFGVSYPTIKNRLNRIGERLGFVEVETSVDSTDSDSPLERLERGEITVDEAIAALGKGESHE